MGAFPPAKSPSLPIQVHWLQNNQQTWNDPGLPIGLRVPCPQTRSLLWSKKDVAHDMSIIHHVQHCDYPLVAQLDGKIRHRAMRFPSPTDLVIFQLHLWDLGPGGLCCVYFSYQWWRSPATNLGVFHWSTNSLTNPRVSPQWISAAAVGQSRLCNGSFNGYIMLYNG